MSKLKKLNKTNNRLELDLIRKGYQRIVGIDEAGRGSWAGPVAVGAYEYLRDEAVNESITDSKLINIKKRLEIFKEYDPKRFLVKYASPQEIDDLNISQAIIVKIKEIIEHYNAADTFFIIDGTFKCNFGVNSMQVIKGDLKHYSIAAASIAAKVSRDLLMCELAIKYPEYAFEKHKGYGTQIHAAAIERAGICEIHRKSYAPIKKYL